MLRNSFHNLSIRAKKSWANRNNTQNGKTDSSNNGQRENKLLSSQVPSRDFSVLDLSSRNMTPSTLRLGITPKMAQDVVELRLGLKEMSNEQELKEWLDMLVDYFPNLKHLYWLDIIANNSNSNNNNNNSNPSAVQGRRQRTLGRIPMLLSLDGKAFTDRERRASGFHKLGAIIEQYQTLETEDRSFAAIFDRESTRMVLLLNVNHGFSMEAVITEMKDSFLQNTSSPTRRQLLEDIHRLLQEKRLVETTENIAIDDNYQCNHEDDVTTKKNDDDKNEKKPAYLPPPPRRARFDYVLRCYRAPDDYPGYAIPIQVFTRRVAVNESLEDIMNKLNGRFEALG